MSLSLSSLLNPSPDAEATPSQTSPPPPQTASSTERRESLPPIQYVASLDQQCTTSPQSAHPPNYHQQHQYSYPPPQEQDALHTLASLSGSSAKQPTQSQWYPPHGASEQGYDSLRRSSSYERRPGSSGYDIQLPPPPPSQARQNSSPTLDQYHVPSRSPDQRRASLISPAQSNFTLPPIQSISPPQQADHSRRPPSGHSSVYDNPHLPVSRVDGTAEVDPKPRQPLTAYQPPPPIQTKSSTMSERADGMDSSPAVIKQEGTPRPSSPAAENLKPFTSVKSEQTPLRDSSVPVPSTETSAPEPAPSKKRPAPSKTKKGIATATVKKAAPSKKRKLDSTKSKPTDRALTPLKALSSKGATPATSSPAASTRSVSASPDDESDEDEDMDSGDAGSSDDVYCLCRKPDTGTFMIGCDGTCDDWFHGKCVGIEERDKNLIDKYVCPNCTKAGAGQTTWKRMCRRHGCRMPARISKSSKTGKEGGGSKFCSEECGVTFFRDMVKKSRGKEDMAKNRSSRRKNSIPSPEQSRNDPDEDLGARGGILAAGELKALVNASKNADEFKKLGDGVLSPPATPDSKGSPYMTKDKLDSNFTESETTALETIHKQKDDARRKHQLLKDRMKFVTMAKQAATRTAAEKELKPKEYCGYDSRIEWTEDQFSAWRDSSAGRKAFELETLASEVSQPANGEDTDAMDEDEEDLDYEICDRKKCARHYEWGKLAVDDLRGEMQDNSDRMRALDREEKEVRERAALRKKAGALEEGRVEVHGLGIKVEDDEGEQEL